MGGLRCSKADALFEGAQMPKDNAPSCGFNSWLDAMIE
jgi:hypothetical protein